MAGGKRDVVPVFIELPSTCAFYLNVCKCVVIKKKNSHFLTIFHEVIDRAIEKHKQLCWKTVKCNLDDFGHHGAHLRLT